ncbi:MAG: DMT family transporter [Burkholderiales bacterium]|nr:DMT family transporter [Burkholderiales bacterium]
MTQRRDERPDGPAHLPAAPLRRLVGRLRRLDPAVRGMLWAMSAGAVFSVLNALLRTLAMQLDPMQTQFLRYVFGCVVLLPLVLRGGVAAYLPRRIGGQFARGFVHTVGLGLWFTALPHVPMADMTALSFTGPIFLMIGAFLFFREPMRWDRWAAALAGFAGVLLVVGPRLSGEGGHYHLVMLLASPVFAASVLLTKSLTRNESAGVIVVWQAITVSVFSLPLALGNWQPVSGWQWAGFAACGVLGSVGNYCQTRALHVTDVSATQPVRFLDLVWASVLGWLMFADIPGINAIAGGLVIGVATLWIARREAGQGGRRG